MRTDAPLATGSDWRRYASGSGIGQCRTADAAGRDGQALATPKSEDACRSDAPVNLDEESMNALVTYIRSLSTPATAIAPAAIATAASPTEPGAAAVVPASVVVTPPQVPANALQTQGRAIFETHRCGSCHGAQGTGGTSAAAALAAAGGSLPPAVLTRMLRHPTNAMQQGGMPPVSITDTELRPW